MTQFDMKDYSPNWNHLIFKGNFLEIIKTCIENHIVLSKFKTKLLVFQM